MTSSSGRGHSAQAEDDDDARACVPSIWLAGMALPVAAPVRNLPTAVPKQRTPGSRLPCAKTDDAPETSPRDRSSKGTHVQVKGEAAKNTQRGRPKRSVVDVARENVKEFSECADGVKYFAAHGNFRRSLERVFREFTDLLDEKTIEHTEDHQTLFKQFQAMLDISKAWVRKGVWDDEMQKTFKSSLLFLRLHPEAPIMFPHWLLQLALTHDVEVFSILMTHQCF